MDCNNPSCRIVATKNSIYKSQTNDKSQTLLDTGDIEETHSSWSYCYIVHLHFIFMKTFLNIHSKRPPNPQSRVAKLFLCREGYYKTIKSIYSLMLWWFQDINRQYSGLLLRLFTKYYIEISCVIKAYVVKFLRTCNQMNSVTKQLIYTCFVWFTWRGNLRYLIQSSRLWTSHKNCIVFIDDKSVCLVVTQIWHVTNTAKLNRVGFFASADHNCHAMSYNH